MGLACVVLAGGRSLRFEGDKLRATVYGKPIVARVVEQAGELTPLVYLSVGDELRGKELLGTVRTPARLLVDGKLGFSGPAVAITTALAGLREEQLLFIPGDLPWIESEALSSLLSICRGMSPDAATVYWHSGLTENLVQLHRRELTAPVALRVATNRRGTMRATDMLRAVPRTCYIDVANVTRNPLCFSDVNTRSALEKPTPRGVIQGPARNLLVEGTPKQSYLRGLNAQLEGDHAAAGEHFEREASAYERMGLSQIAVHCLEDSLNARGMAGEGAEDLAHRILKLRRAFVTVEGLPAAPDTETGL